MLKIKQIDKTRELYYEENYTVTQICNKLNISRNSVYKYIHQDDFNSIVRKSRSDQKIIPYIDSIDRILSISTISPRKQKLTYVRIFELLKEEYPNLKLSYFTLRNYVRNIKSKYKNNFQCYLPLNHFPGEAQVDFFECDFILKNKYTNGYAVILSFPYSNASYCQVFRGKTLECLLEGMKNIFLHTSGVPHTIVFDNDACIVQHNAQKKKIINGNFLRFKNHNGFRFKFCNVRSAYEKGNVEVNVRYLRNQLFTPMPTFDNIEDFNNNLLKSCDKLLNREHYIRKTVISELFLQDKKSFISLPKINFETSDIKLRKVNKNGKVTLDRIHHYYLDSHYALQKVLVTKTYDKILIYDYNTNREITNFSRQFGDSINEIVDWGGFLPIIAAKPGSIANLEFIDLFTDQMKQYLVSIDKKELKNILKQLGKVFSETKDLTESIKLLEKDITN